MSHVLGESPVPIKALCLRMLVVACTGVDNICQNPFYEYFIQHSVFESLVHILCQTSGTTTFSVNTISLVYY